MGKRDERVWTAYDDCLLYTCHVVHAQLTGQTSQLQATPTHFPPMMGPDERVLVTGPGALDVWDAPGDGTYQPAGGTFLATGPGALRTMAGFYAVQGLINSGRRRRAQTDRQPRWLPMSQGALHISTHAFYLESHDSLLPFPWGSLDAAVPEGPALVRFLARQDAGGFALLVRSHWAELAFVSWAAARHPHHPALTAGEWLPQGWWAWAKQQRATWSDLPPLPM